MKESMIFGLIAGTCIGLVTATMYKPARDVVNKGTKMAKQTVQELTKEAKK